ncbi:MAG: heme o synthase [Cyanobacteria bacterium J06632_22]
MQPTTWDQPQKHHENFGQVLRSYLQLTKPRIIPLLLIETAGSMWVAAQGQLNMLLLLVTLLGGALAAASAQVINCVYDRDIDYDMERTRHRPLPSGRIQVQDALIFAAVLALASFSLLTAFANLLAAGLAMLGIVVYIAVYTHWLKRSSPQNIVIGGAAGAIPPMVGWAAVTGELGWAAWIFFGIVFIWTPPHFWALALLIQDDYAKVNIPMLPVVAGDEETANQIWLYTLILVPLTLLMVCPTEACGWVYGAIATYLGVIFLRKAYALRQCPSNRDLAKDTFKYSIFYMMLLSAAMVVDSLPVVRHGVTAVTSYLVALI